MFRFAAAVFIGLNPLEEEGIVKDLAGRLIDPLQERETETVQIVFKADADDQPLPNGTISLKSDAPERLLLLAEALATSVAFAYNEGRIGQAFDKVVPIASSLKQRKLLVGSQGACRRADQALVTGQRPRCIELLSFPRPIGSQTEPLPLPSAMFALKRCRDTGLR